MYDVVTHIKIPSSLVVSRFHDHDSATARLVGGTFIAKTVLIFKAVAQYGVPAVEAADDKDGMQQDAGGLWEREVGHAVLYQILEQRYLTMVGCSNVVLCECRCRCRWMRGCVKSAKPLVIAYQHPHRPSSPFLTQRHHHNTFGDLYLATTVTYSNDETNPKHLSTTLPPMSHLDGDDIRLCKMSWSVRDAP
jgi:hypothetical protein